MSTNETQNKRPFFVEKSELYVINFVDAAEKTAPEKFSTNAEI